MNRKISDRQLANRAHAASQLLGSRPPVRLAFNFINFQGYKYKFLADNVRHPTQVFVLEKFILLSQIFITKHGKSWFFHSHSQLKESLGLDAKTVKKVVDVLVKRKVLRRKKAGRTGTYHYKIEYPTLMRQYRSFLIPEIFEDKAVRAKVYFGPLCYFAYMAKFCKHLKNEPASDKSQTKTVKSQEAKKSPERVIYSPEMKRFIKDEFDEDYERDEDEDSDDYDPDYDLPPAPSSPRKKLSELPTTKEGKIAYLQYKSPHLSYNEAKKLIEKNERQNALRRYE